MVDLQKFKPVFKAKAKELIRRYIKNDSLVQHVLEDLKKLDLKYSLLCNLMIKFIYYQRHVTSKNQ